MVGFLDGLDDLGMRDPVGRQFLGIEHDLVLTHHAAHGGHLGDIGHGLQFVLEEPVLQGAQLRSVLCAAAVDQRVLVDPADAGGIGPERGLGTGGQARLHLVQVLQHPRARPVQVGPVLEQHVDEGIAEERIAAHCLRTRH